MAALLFGAAGLLFLAAPCLLAYHAFVWLKHGLWWSWSVLDALAWLDEGMLAWAWNPRSWQGLHTALAWLPLWAFCWLASIALAMLGAMADEASRNVPSSNA